MSNPPNRTFSEDSLRPRSTSRFTRTFAIVVVALVAACAVFAALGYFQGPKLQSARVDLTALVSKPGQQLGLFANQPLAEVSAAQVSVEPTTPISVSTVGDVISVQFDRMLDYATQYTVRVDGVTGATSSQGSSMEYSFTTPMPHVYLLERGDTADEVVRVSVGGNERTVVYTGQRIQDFTTVGSALAVLSITPDGLSDLKLVDLRDGVVEQVMLPAPGVITQLDASTVGAALGFVFAPQGGDAHELLAVNYDLGARLTPVLGLSGEPLDVNTWQFIPGGTQLVAHSIDAGLFLVDLATESIAPLKQFAEVGRVSRDGASLTVKDAMGTSTMSLPGGEVTQLVASPLGEAHPFVGAIEVLPDGPSLAKIAFQTTDGKFRTALALDDGTEMRVVYENEGASLENFTVSPNGQLVAVEVVPDFAEAVSDGYERQSSFTTTVTHFIDIRSGRVVATRPGLAPHW